MKTPAGQPLSPHRRAWAQMPIGALVIEGAFSRKRIDEVRARLDAAGFSPAHLRHLGHYEWAPTLDEPSLIAELHEMAEYVTDASSSLRDWAGLRLRRGDYVLSAAGEPAWDDEERGYEVTLDLSAGSSGEAQVVYARRGEHFFAAPQLSGSVTIVERGPEITRYDRYLNHRVGDRVVHRLRLAFRRSGVLDTA